MYVRSGLDCGVMAGMKPSARKTLWNLAQNSVKKGRDSLMLQFRLFVPSGLPSRALASSIPCREIVGVCTRPAVWTIWFWDTGFLLTSWTASVAVWVWICPTEVLQELDCCSYPRRCFQAEWGYWNTDFIWDILSHSGKCRRTRIFRYPLDWTLELPRGSCSSKRYSQKMGSAMIEVVDSRPRRHYRNHALNWRPNCITQE